MPLISYQTWKQKVEEYVADPKQEELALLGLFHMVTGDLPGSTKAPTLDDENATRALQKDLEVNKKKRTPAGVTKEAVASYLSYLVARGFMEAPSTKSLPARTIPKAQADALEKVGGRGGSN